MGEDTSVLKGKWLQRMAARTVASTYFWVSIIAFMFVIPIVRTLQLQNPEPVAQLGPVHPFQLLDESDAAFESKSLVDRIWVATMVCSACPNFNPEQMETLAKIRGKTKNMVDAFRLVSFTLDPKTDRPEKLAALELAHGLSQRWIFLTSVGDSHDAVDTILDNIYAYDESHRLAKRSRAPGELPPRLGHMIALVDRNMCVRAYYDLRDDDVLNQLMSGINNVLHVGTEKQPCMASAG